MRALRYLRIDVFTERPFHGNPLAVFVDAEGLETAEMQAMAREMNLSETTFVLPPTPAGAAAGAAARVRIFTIDRELPLAGHPVVGTAFALAASGALQLQRGRNEVVLELGAGLLPVEIDVGDEGRIGSVVMTQRPPKFGARVDDAHALAAALSLPPFQIDVETLPARVVDTGIPWFLIPVHDLRSLSSLRADPARCAVLAQEVGTDLFHAFTLDTGDPGCAVRTRHVFFGSVTPGEDAVTGSAIGCIAAYLVAENVLLAAPEAEFTIEQGADVGRPGVVTARVRASGGAVTRVQVGGRAVQVGQGELWL